MKFSREVIASLISNSKIDHKGNNLYGDCPYCGENEFGISLKDNHLWRCFRGNQCGETGNIFMLLEHLGRTELYRDQDFYKTTDVNKLKRNELNKVEELMIVLPAISKPLGFKRCDDNWYLKDRGFTASQFSKYNVGTTRLINKYKDYVIILIEQYGDLVGFVGRNTKSKKEIDDINKQVKQHNKVSPNKRKLIARYINSTDTDFSKIVYGIDEINFNTHTIIIVEGLLDKINLEIIYPELFKDGSAVVVCTWGKKISPEQLQIIKEEEIVTAVIMYDPDAVDSSKKYGFDLKSVVEEVQVGYHKEKDPGDLNRQEFIEILENLQSPQQFNYDRIQKREFK